jgi:hypothetical protein
MLISSGTWTKGHHAKGKGKKKKNLERSKTHQFGEEITCRGQQHLKMEQSQGNRAKPDRFSQFGRHQRDTYSGERIAL